MQWNILTVYFLHKWFLYSFVIFCITTLVTVHFMIPAEDLNEKIPLLVTRHQNFFCDRWEEDMTVYRNCLLQQQSSLWQKLSNVTFSCLWHATAPNKTLQLPHIQNTEILEEIFQMWSTKTFKIEFLKNHDEPKGLIRVSKTSGMPVSCLEVTLGVGNDIGAEEKLLKIYPECSLHGLDPTPLVGNIFTKVGHYYPIAIGPKDKDRFESFILGPQGYNLQQINSTTFANFVNVHLKVKFIDLLWIDIEGSEYRVFDQFFRDGELFTSSGVTVCQMNAEFHGPLPKYGMDIGRFHRVLLSIFENSDFLPLFSRELIGNPDHHWRVFLFNSASKVCFNKFLSDKCI